VEPSSKRERDLRDIEIINRNAERLNREALDVLEYQDLLMEEPLSPDSGEPRSDPVND
jgi:hypothetical protein